MEEKTKEAVAAADLAGKIILLLPQELRFLIVLAEAGLDCLLGFLLTQRYEVGQGTTPVEQVEELAELILGMEEAMEVPEETPYLRTDLEVEEVPEAIAATEGMEATAMVELEQQEAAVEPEEEAEEMEALVLAAAAVVLACSVKEQAEHHKQAIAVAGLAAVEGQMAKPLILDLLVATAATTAEGAEGMPLRFQVTTQGKAQFVLFGGQIVLSLQPIHRICNPWKF